MVDAEILTVQHVQIAIPEGGEDQARVFYQSVLGFAEVPKPLKLAGRGGCWLATKGVSLHLGVDPAFTPAKKAHPAFIVQNLDEFRRRAENANCETRDDIPVLNFKRFFVFDPFGNRIELMEPLEKT